MKLTEKQKHCKFCHAPFKHIWMFGNTVEMYIEPDGSGYYLTLQPNDDPEDVGSLYNELDEVEIVACPMCGRPLSEEEDK